MQIEKLRAELDNVDARIKLEGLFKSLSTLRDIQDYYIKVSEDSDVVMDAIATRDELNASLLTIKEIKNLLMEQEL
jgi:ribonuclease HI